VWQRLATNGCCRRTVEYEQRKVILKDRTGHLCAITGPIARADPDAALEWLWQVQELGGILARPLR
jgi:hypothetical protein